jgi:hypothetical protein
MSRKEWTQKDEEWVLKNREMQAQKKDEEWALQLEVMRAPEVPCQILRAVGDPEGGWEDDYLCATCGASWPEWQRIWNSCRRRLERD